MSMVVKRNRSLGQWHVHARTLARSSSTCTCGCSMIPALTPASRPPSHPYHGPARPSCTHPRMRTCARTTQTTTTDPVEGAGRAPRSCGRGTGDVRRARMKRTGGAPFRVYLDGPSEFDGCSRRAGRTGGATAHVRAILNARVIVIRNTLV